MPHLAHIEIRVVHENRAVKLKHLPSRQAFSVDLLDNPYGVVVNVAFGRIYDSRVRGGVGGIAVEVISGPVSPSQMNAAQ